MWLIECWGAVARLPDPQAGLQVGREGNLIQTIEAATKKGSGSSYQQRGPEPGTEKEWLQVALGMSQGGVRRPLPAQLPKTEEEGGGNQVYNSIHWKEQNQLQRKEQ